MYTPVRICVIVKIIGDVLTKGFSDVTKCAGRYTTHLDNRV